jgi:hypothetical protein
MKRVRKFQFSWKSRKRNRRYGPKALSNKSCGDAWYTYFMSSKLLSVNLTVSKITNEKLTDTPESLSCSLLCHLVIMNYSITINKLTLTCGPLETAVHWGSCGGWTRVYVTSQLAPSHFAGWTGYGRRNAAHRTSTLVPVVFLLTTCLLCLGGWDSFG